MNPRSRSLPILVGAALLVAAAMLPAGARSVVARAVAPGDPAPALSAAALEGWKYQADWRPYEFTIVNFWATWCEPCRSEMPALQELFARYRERKLAVVGVLLDSETDDEVRSFAKNLGVDYRIVRGDTDLSNVWGGIGILPTTFVVNSRGRVVKRYVGATPEQIARLKSDVEALFPDPAPAR